MINSPMTGSKPESWGMQHTDHDLTEPEGPHLRVAARARAHLHSGDPHTSLSLSLHRGRTCWQ